MTRNWEDLKPRVLSAIVMAVVGLAAIITGGLVFDVLMLAVALLGLRELWQIQRPRLGNPFDVMILFGYGFAILAACLAFVILRAGDGAGGMSAIFFLVAIVITSDVMGYFAGRTLGGPKFWPRISPKKTWSGTIAGWAGAAIVGVVVWWNSDSAATWAGVPLWAFISAILAFAGQMGDIAQSAIKRRAGVKDSSNLIPGHGGILDRFDAMIGVGMIVAILILLSGA